MINIKLIASTSTQRRRTVHGSSRTPQTTHRAGVHALGGDEAVAVLVAAAVEVVVDARHLHIVVGEDLEQREGAIVRLFSES